MRWIKCLGLAAAVIFLQSCEQTDFAPGFDENVFIQVKVGERVEDVVAKLGPPLQIRVHSSDYQRHPLPSGRSQEIIGLAQLSKASTDPRRFVVLCYSLQSNPHRDYWRNNIKIQDGKVFGVVHELVTE